MDLVKELIHWVKNNRLFCGLLVIFLLITLTNLSNVYLWEDEAETANLAWNILRFGWPNPWDGVNFISQLGGPGVVKIGNYFFWSFHPWLHFYLIAPFLAILGKTIFAVRLPSVIFGLISVVLFYRVLQENIPSINKSVAVGIVGMLVLNPAFLVLVRQARYYSLTFCLVLLSSLIYLRFARIPSSEISMKKFRSGFLGWVLSLILLFHTNYQAFLALGIVQVFYAVVFNRWMLKKEYLGTYLIGLVLLVATTAPFGAMTLLNRPESSSISTSRIGTALRVYWHHLNIYLAPGWLALGGIIALPRFSDPKGRRLWFYSLLVVICSVFVLLITTDWPFFRYISFVMPFAIIAILLPIITHSWKWGVIWMIGMLGLFAGKDGYWEKYYYELTHTYRGPEEGITDFLKTNADSEATVYVDCLADPLIFHTGLRVVNRLTREYRENWGFSEVPLKEIDYIIDRETCGQTYSNDDLSANFELVVLDYPDLGHENGENLEQRIFYPPEEAPPVKIWVNERLVIK
jgi:hypothetical protein